MAEVCGHLNILVLCWTVSAFLPNPEKKKKKKIKKKSINLALGITVVTGKCSPQTVPHMLRIIPHCCRSTRLVTQMWIQLEEPLGPVFSFSRTDWGLNPHRGAAMIWQKYVFFMSFHRSTQPTLQRWWLPGVLRPFQTGRLRVSREPPPPPPPPPSQSFAVCQPPQPLCHILVIYSWLQRGERRINRFWKKNECASGHEEVRKKERFTASSEGMWKLKRPRLKPAAQLTPWRSRRSFLKTAVMRRVTLSAAWVTPPGSGDLSHHASVAPWKIGCWRSTYFETAVGLGVSETAAGGDMD